MTLLTDWCVPRAALRTERPVADEVTDYLRSIGVVVPDPDPVAMRWTPDFEARDVTRSELETWDDDERYEWLIIEPETLHLEDLGHIVTGMVEERHRRYPHPLSWRRWRITRSVLSRLYTLGLVAGYSDGHDRRDPVGSCTIGFVRFTAGRGPYLLGKPRWWWECLRRQGWTLDRHAPEQPWGFGVCAACAPCPWCGAHRDCADDCSGGAA